MPDNEFKMKDAHIKNREFYRGRKILVTGHTGFKGAWLTAVLSYLQTDAWGYALAPDQGSLYEKIDGDQLIHNVTADVRDREHLASTMTECMPEVVIHLAALAQVKDCFDDPVRAYETNIMGTVNLLEAIRKCPSVKSLVIVTTDKVYENKGDGAVYAEDDPLGGSDPYADSKAEMEHLIKTYLESYFRKEGRVIGVATVRASNVLGGGDHIRSRLIPTILCSVADGTPVEIRNPLQTRPWQSVLDALNGYLTVGRYLYQNPEQYTGAWNIGPTQDGIRTVSWVVEKIRESFAGLKETAGEALDVKESATLGLSIDKALNELDWEPRMTCEKTVEQVVAFFLAQQKNKPENEICFGQIREFYEGESK